MLFLIKNQLTTLLCRLSTLWRHLTWVAPQHVSFPRSMKNVFPLPQGYDITTLFASCETTRGGEKPRSCTCLLASYSEKIIVLYRFNFGLPPQPEPFRPLVGPEPGDILPFLRSRRSTRWHGLLKYFPLLNTCLRSLLNSSIFKVCLAPNERFINSPRLNKKSIQVVTKGSLIHLPPIGVRAVKS